ncbi:LuxR C-terminal-related transcriptional regulator [Streptomyces sp. NPDC057582]|uniref:LuxR C-terminal-related transcriptional regulator n=1 Tax=Streptomyces sp. NPDC057582 TaxID=3346174 RepID=UPI0036800ADC
MRQSREHAETLGAQTAAQAVTAERLRIAREMHDTVAHSIGIVALQAGAARQLGGITDREREILTLVGRGLSNTEIAAELVISVATVKTYVTRLLSKLDARDRVQLVILAYETGLVTLPR